MLMYLYTLQYPQAWTEPRGAKGMIFDAKMYAIADKYGIPHLKSKAKQAFEHMMDLYLTFDYKRLVEVIIVVYETTPECDRGLRDLVRDYIWNYPWLLQQRDVQEAILGHATLMRDIMKTFFASLS